jgi:ABC-type cobalamin/Fe3+-siderophores transport system ATPase subunit
VRGSLNYSSKITNAGHVLQYLTENNDFMVIGVIGPPGVGKSTIMNELYGYDASSPGTIQLYFLLCSFCVLRKHSNLHLLL